MDLSHTPELTFFAWCEDFEEVGGCNRLTAEAAIHDLCLAIAEYIYTNEGGREDYLLNKAGGASVKVYVNRTFEHLVQPLDTSAFSDPSCLYHLTSWHDLRHLVLEADIDEDGNVQVEAI